MNVVIVIEILIGLVVLGAVVRYAVRDTRRRAASAPPADDTEPSPELPERNSEHDTEKAPSEVADRA